MGNCNSKIKHTCAGIQTAALCTMYEGTLSVDSNLTEGDCLDVQEVIEDLYELHDAIKIDINVADISNDCIVFSEPKKINSVVKQMYLKLCQLEELIQTQATDIITMQQEIIELQANNCP